MSDAVLVVTSNRKATHEYHIDDRVEAGLVLQGTEVKSVRAGKVNLQEAYCAVDKEEQALKCLGRLSLEFLGVPLSTLECPRVA